MRITPCSSRIFAAFRPPMKGDRIVLPGMAPGDYYWVDESPEMGQDARGRDFWSVRVKTVPEMEGGQPGSRLLRSEDVSSWSHFKGQNTPWHQGTLDQRKWERDQKQQEAQIGEFEAQHTFPDGRPLRTHPSRPLVVRISEDATGNLELFQGENLKIKSIDYATQMASLEPVDPEVASDPQIMQLLMAVPTSELMAASAPVMSGRAAQEKVRIPARSADGQDAGFEYVSSEDLLHMTPELNRLASRGQVALSAQVYMNYQSGRGTGAQIFESQMEARGMDPTSVPYEMNNTPQKYNPDGAKANLLGPWTGTIVISPPISDEAIEEAKRVASKSQVIPMADGGVKIYSNALFKNMVSLGVLDNVGTSAQPAPAVRPAAQTWLESNCRFGQANS